MNRVTTPKLPPPPRSAQKRSAFSSRLAVRISAVRGDDLDLLEVVRRPAEATRQVTQPAAERQAGDADLGGEGAQRRGQPVRLCRPVDVPEQAPGADLREPRVRVDGDVAQARHVERQTALGDRGSGHVVAPALDAQQQPVVTRESDRRSDVGGRGRLEDKRGNLRDHAVPDQHGIVPARVARAKHGTLDSRVQLVELLRRQPDEAAVESGDVDGARIHACPSVIQLNATPFTGTRLAGFGQLSGDLPSWPKTAGTLDAGCDDEQHRRGLRELLPAEREP